jgi:hypothetical protein
VTRPPLPSLLRFLPSPRYVASRAPGIVKFDAPCPHGSVVEWDGAQGRGGGIGCGTRHPCPRHLPLHVP